MLHIAVWMTLPILIVPVWSQEQFREVTLETREPRFGFGYFEPIRKMYCNNFCTSADNTLYILNLLCAVKCPELYLPHNGTTIRIVNIPSSPETPPKAQGQAIQAIPGTQATLAAAATQATKAAATTTTTITTTTPPKPPPQGGMGPP